jgi:hypothetical protein
MKKTGESKERKHVLARSQQLSTSSALKSYNYFMLVPLSLTSSGVAVSSTISGVGGV